MSKAMKELRSLRDGIIRRIESRGGDARDVESQRDEAFRMILELQRSLGTDYKDKAAERRRVSWMSDAIADMFDALNDESMSANEQIKRARVAGWKARMRIQEEEDRVRSVWSEVK